MTTRRRILLVQLPIPPSGMEPEPGNVPLAAGYLQLYARRAGIEAHYEIEILPTVLANRLGDRGLVEAILSREPWMVGFTCYLWNVERSLWVAEQLKARRPELRVLLGGPEITADNGWVLRSSAVDWAAIGEGEQTFAELLEALRRHDRPPAAIPGLWAAPRGAAAGSDRLGAMPPSRTPLPGLDAVSSPYVEGILDAAQERMLFLETIRGCVFDCKFCYYPKSYSGLHFLSREQIAASLRHARERGVEEVTLLDPTLNQRRDFAGFLRLLAAGNPDHAFEYFGELRAEGIDAEIASLLRAANFDEVEIGLQSEHAHAQALMGRRSSRRAYERGVRALLDAGLHVKIDLILGLPGDTPETVRQGIRHLRDSGLYSEVQVFNLSVLPGTAFRAEAFRLGLEYQRHPPYYVLGTPAIGLGDICGLMAEAQEAFDTEFEALPAPRLDRGPLPGDPPGCVREWRVDLDLDPAARDPVPPAERRAQAFTLWIRGRDLEARGEKCASLAAGLVADNPHTTLQLVLEPTSEPRRVTPALLDRLLAACYRAPTYLDHALAILPGAMKGSKRIVVVAPLAERERAGAEWIGAIGDCATLVWRGVPAAELELEEHEHVQPE